MIDFDGETIKSHHLPLSDIVWVHSTLYDLVIGLLLNIELTMIILRYYHHIVIVIIIYSFNTCAALEAQPCRYSAINTSSCSDISRLRFL